LPEHFIAYAAVSAVAAIAFHRHIRPRQLAPAMIGYAAVLELAQWWSPGRSPGMIEFAAGSAGAVAGIFLGAVLLRNLAR
jgi:VanZ family protein